MIPANIVITISNNNNNDIKHNNVVFFLRKTMQCVHPSHPHVFSSLTAAASALIHRTSSAQGGAARTALGLAGP